MLTISDWIIFRIAVVDGEALCAYTDTLAFTDCRNDEHYASKSLPVNIDDHLLKIPSIVYNEHMTALMYIAESEFSYRW